MIIVMIITTIITTTTYFVERKNFPIRLKKLATKG